MSEETLDSGEAFEMPTSKKMMRDMLEDADVPEEMKDQLRAMYTDNLPKIFGYTGGSLMAFVFVLIIFAIIFFFGYKLYKSIKDKELKKEQKKKQKQQKKKK